MNCRCQPPQPAVIRQVNKANENQGRKFYCCAQSNCQFFHWVDEALLSIQPPPALNKQGMTSGNGPLSSGPSAANAAVKKAVWKLKISIAEFEEYPPKIWFNIIGSKLQHLTKLFNSLPSDQKRYKETLKLWLCNFSIYETFISRLIAEFPDAEVQELPRFLVVGLRSYLATYNDVITGQKPCDPEPELNIDEEFLGTLLPFQVEGIRFVIRHRGRALIGE